MKIQVGYDYRGSTIYAHIRNEDGELWNGAAFEAYSAGHWGNYDIALTEQGSSGVYVGDVPAAIDLSEQYEVFVYEQAGGSPAATDSLVGAGSLIDLVAASEAAVTGGVSSIVTAIGNLNDLSSADVATAVGGVVIDALGGGVDLATAVRRIHNFTAAKKIAITSLDPLTLVVYRNDGTTTDYTLAITVPTEVGSTTTRT